MIITIHVIDDEHGIEDTSDIDLGKSPGANCAIIAIARGLDTSISEVLKDAMHLGINDLVRPKSPFSHFWELE